MSLSHTQSLGLGEAIGHQQKMALESAIIYVERINPFKCLKKKCLFYL